MKDNIPLPTSKQLSTRFLLLVLILCQGRRSSVAARTTTTTTTRGPESSSASVSGRRCPARNNNPWTILRELRDSECELCTDWATLAEMLDTNVTPPDGSASYHVVVVLLGMPRLERAIVLMAELLARRHAVTAITTAHIADKLRLHEIFYHHTPCNFHPMGLLNVEVLTLNENHEWPCHPPQPSDSFEPPHDIARFRGHKEPSHRSTKARSSPDDAGTRSRDDGNPHAHDRYLHCNAEHAYIVARRLNRLITKGLPKQPDVLVVDSQLLAGIIVAENLRVPSLALVDDFSAAALKWTHPHYHQQQVDQRTSRHITTRSRRRGGTPISSSTNSGGITGSILSLGKGMFTPFTSVVRQCIHWGEALSDNLAMTGTFINYNSVRRRLNLPPRLKISEFWKTTLLWTSLTLGTQFNASNLTTAASVFPEYGRYPYRRRLPVLQGPLLTLPEPIIPPCLPCNHQSEQKDAETSSGRVQILLPYFGHSNTIVDRQIFRRLTRAFVLARDSLLAWPRCPVDENETAASYCWTRNKRFADFEVIRLGTSHEAFVPSIIKFSGVPSVLDALAQFHNIVAIVTACHSPATHWTQDLGLPTYCLPVSNDVNDWNVRQIAMDIARMVRQIERQQRNSRETSTLAAKSNAIPAGGVNHFTHYGSSIVHVADVIQRMAEVKQNPEGVWRTADDMIYELWHRLELVGGAIGNGESVEDDDQTNWGWHMLLAMSWTVVLATVIYVALKDTFPSFFVPSSSTSSMFRPHATRRHASNSNNTNASNSIGNSRHSTRVRTWREFLHEVGTLIKGGFWERLPDIDRVVSQCKEWLSTESAWIDQRLSHLEATATMMTQTSAHQASLDSGPDNNAISSGKIIASQIISIPTTRTAANAGTSTTVIGLVGTRNRNGILNPDASEGMDGSQDGVASVPSEHNHTTAARRRGKSASRKH